MPPMAKSIVKNLNIKYLVRVCYYVITYALLSAPTYQWVFFLFSFGDWEGGSGRPYCTKKLQRDFFSP